MYCSNCGKELQEDLKFCDGCGTAMVKEIKEDDLPEKYRPLGAWTYFWLSVLFAVPIVGFIFLIIFSFNDSNINRRSFARSYWCAYLIVAIALAVMLIFAAILGVGLIEAIQMHI